jgi:para-aminobenzoate synthetase/4-amino-4-deoxychorismate lyase
MTIEAVEPALREVERAADIEGLLAAGFVSYEASPAFDSALQVRADKDFPLLWFGLFERVEARPTLSGGFPMEGESLLWEPEIEKADYLQAIESIRDEIRLGNTYQVNFTYRLRSKAPSNPWQLFLRMVSAQGPGYSAFLDTGRWCICSASPELFFRREGVKLESRPMKGTAKRGRTLGEDNKRARELAGSSKERAENIMIVDMVRNDLGRIAETGSVEVSSLCDLEKYPTVWQMTSAVTAQSNVGLAEIFDALFPPASITGAPKPSTMGIIAALERSPRRVYTGALGFLLPGRSQFNVAIRTVLVDKQNEVAEYGTGGGITWDSKPGAEFEESLIKARVLHRAIQPFLLLETLRWDRRDGYILLEEHLSRLMDSAFYFDYEVDEAEVRRALATLSATFASGPRRVRLTADSAGKIALSHSRLEPLGSGQPCVAFAPRPVDSSDAMLFHKTTYRRVYEEALAARPGFSDVLLFNERGEVTESTIANVAVELDGLLCTPPVGCGLLPGTRRARMLVEGSLKERPMTIEEVAKAPRVFLLNSVRGIWQVEVRRPEAI